MSASDQLEADQIDSVCPPEQSQGVVGHGAVMAQLMHQLTERRLPGAILLHGPLGIGKATFAFDLARRVLVETGDEPNERVAEQIASGSHPNMFMLRRKVRDTGNGYYAVIRVEDVRAIQQRMRQTRGRAGYRIAIVDSIDDCNTSSANALLKILEEPPANTLFLLISHRPGSLLPTIRSRCHAYALRPLSDDDVGVVINRQEIEAEEGAKVQAITLATGRPRRAIEALLLENQDALISLDQWLLAPGSQGVGKHIALAEVVAKSGGAAAAFAREMVINRLADEAKQALNISGGSSKRLASATELWEKANTMFAEADSYNLDAKQTLVSIFDALRRHDLAFVDRRPAGQS